MSLETPDAPPVQFLAPGTRDDPLVVVRSRFWRFNAIGFFDGDEACVVDPGIYPDEIAALGHAVRSAAGGDRRVTHVVVTHSHHDHIRGWMRFPGARVVCPRVAAEKPETARARIMASKRTVDTQLRIDDPGFTYPRADVVFDDRASVSVGGRDVEARFVPGHSNCTSVVLIPSLRTLCTADYLVSPGLPYCRWQARDFEQAMRTIARWCEEEGIERILPAHNDPITGREAIARAIREELDYFTFLRGRVRSAMAAGETRESCARIAARALRERRGVDLGRKELQDLDNARRVLEEEWTE